jgi:GxxExxY protein
MLTESDLNKISGAVLDSAIKVHRILGPGLLESVYERALTHELSLRSFRAETQVPITFDYEGVRFDEGFRADVIVNDLIIVEIKSVESLKDVHKKQLLTYLKLSGRKIGLLINFNESLLKDGFVRIVNELH